MKDSLITSTDSANCVAHLAFLASAPLSAVASSKGYRIEVALFYSLENTTNVLESPENDHGD
jgi:hypothetical protein